MIDQINKSKESGAVITQGTIDEMAKSNPEIKKMINGSDTVVSVWQKLDCKHKDLLETFLN